MIRIIIIIICLLFTAVAGAVEWTSPQLKSSTAKNTDLIMVYRNNSGARTIPVSAIVGVKASGPSVFTKPTNAEATIASINRVDGLELYKWVVSAYDEPLLYLRNGDGANLLTVNRLGGMSVANYLSSPQLGIGRPYDAAHFSRMISTEAYGSTYELQTLPEGQSWLPVLKWDRSRSYLGIEANNLGLGTSQFGTGASRVLALASGTAPTTSPADTVQLWSGDVAGDGTAGLYIRAEDGTRHVFGDKVGIGTTSPMSKLHVQGTAVAVSGTAKAVVQIVDDSSMAAGVGGAISFLGKYTAAGDVVASGYIQAEKTNATELDYSFDLAFGTRENGYGVAERMRINNLGNVGIGTINPVFKLDVRGPGYFATAAGTNQVVLGDLTNGTWASIANNNANLIFSPGANEALRITPSGLTLATGANIRMPDAANGKSYAFGIENGIPYLEEL